MAEHSVTLQICFYNVSPTKIYFENLKNSFEIQFFSIFFFTEKKKKENASKLTGKRGNQYKGFIRQELNKMFLCASVKIAYTVP